MIILRQKQFTSLRKKLINKLTEKSNEHKDRDPELCDKLVKEAKKNNVSAIVVSSKYPNSFVTKKDGKSAIILNKDDSNIYSFSHEVGHSYYKSGEGKNKFGGKLHKLTEKIKKGYLEATKKKNPELVKGPNSKSNPEKTKELIKKSKKLRRGVGSVVSGISGLAAGYLAEGEKRKGRSGKSKLITAGSLLVPIMGHVPQMGSEIAASKKGLEYLKESGASEDQIKNSKKSNRYALGSYGVDLGKNLLINSGGLLAGKGLYKLTHKKK